VKKKEKEEEKNKWFGWDKIKKKHSKVQSPTLSSALNLKPKAPPLFALLM